MIEITYYNEECSINAAEIALSDNKGITLTTPNQYGESIILDYNTRILYDSQKIVGVIFLMKNIWKIVWKSEYSKYL